MHWYGWHIEYSNALVWLAYRIQQCIGMVGHIRQSGPSKLLYMYVCMRHGTACEYAWTTYYQHCHDMQHHCHGSNYFRCAKYLRILTQVRHALMIRSTKELISNQTKRLQSRQWVEYVLHILYPVSIMLIEYFLFFNPDVCRKWLNVCRFVFEPD